MTIRKYQMFKPDERVLVACSGGADSVALVHCLHQMTAQHRICLSLVHFDHRLRRASDKDFKFVRSLARHLDLPFYGGKRGKNVSLKSGLSPEEAAREIRYDFFKHVAQKTRIRKMALGHQRDDQAETVLMRLIQGTGLRGLQGIRPVMKREGLTLIRPLIETSRDEIRCYLKENSIRYREDATNRSGRFLRNRMRSHLLPLLEKKYNPKIREALWRLAETSFQESAGLDQWVNETRNAYLKARRNGTVWLDRENFLKLPLALQFRILDRHLHELNPQSGLDFKSWARIEQGFKKGRFRMTLPKDLDLNLTSQKLFIREKSPKKAGLALGRQR